MEKREYLDKVEQAAINSDKVEKVTKLYGAEMPDIIQRILSSAEEAVFFDDGVRILSYDEIVDAEKDLHIEFARKGIIPIADCGENDFIVYHFRDDIWSKFNIVDESVFKKKKSIEELLK
jgi:putative inositol monophosphatase